MALLLRRAARAHTGRGFGTATQLVQALAERCAGFVVPAQHVQVLDQPQDYYQALLDGVQSSRSRITLAALYLGTSKLERRLVDAIAQRCRQVSGLSVTVLLDHSRGTRGGAAASSAALLRPLVQQFPGQVRLCFLQLPQMRSGWTRVLPPRYNEALGVQHLKAYAFDDTLVMSGANMSHDYFTNRQDRYWRFVDCTALAQFHHLLVDQLAPFAHELRAGDAMPLPHSPPSSVQGRTLVQSMRKTLEAALRDQRLSGAAVAAALGQPDAAVALSTLQLPAVGVEVDHWATRAVFQHGDPTSCLSVATGYLNLPREYQELLVARPGRVRVVTAAPQANGFYRAPRLAGAVATAYSEIAREFYTRVKRAGRGEDVELHEFVRPAWTFHGKGLWLSGGAPGQGEEAAGAGREMPRQSRDATGAEREAPWLASIGSPNFGFRSVQVDLESQLFVASSSTTLRQAWQAEVDALFADCEQVTDATWSRPDRQLHGMGPHFGWWIHPARRLLRRFL